MWGPCLPARYPTCATAAGPRPSASATGWPARGCWSGSTHWAASPTTGSRSTSPTGTTSSRLHRAGPGPPRRPRRPGRAPRRARPDGIARLYAGADVFVLPSWREPYGTVYGEALAAGLPVVGWRAGNLPHLVSDGVEGVVLDPRRYPGPRRRTRPAGQRRSVAGRRGAALPRWSHTAATLFAALKELTASAR